MEEKIEKCAFILFCCDYEKNYNDNIGVQRGTVCPSVPVWTAVDENVRRGYRYLAEKTLREMGQI